ncbi:DUF2860 family protein [Vibrio mimicus]|uniref:DUF2860 family protein n=1 Tax=Vibrio mimicus TaxID=674 RepID=UPI0012AC8D57|nr:DUF2860 family protein [Vibrio mimicus]
MNRKPLALLLSCAFFSIPSLAKPIEWRPGFSGDISLNAGFSQTNSQLNTDDSNAITQSLNGTGKQLETVSPLILGRLQYTFGHQALFFGNSEDQISEAQFQSELGWIGQISANTYLTLAVFGNIPGMDETWQDPYLTGLQRTKTDHNVVGARTALEVSLPFPVTLKYAYADSEIEHDIIGQSQALTSSEQHSLLRSSTYQRFGAEIHFPLSMSIMLSPGFYYTDQAAEGSAQSHTETAAQLSFFANLDRHQVVATLRSSKSKYEQDNPVFGRKRDDDAFAMFAVYGYQDPFALSHTQLNVMAGYQQQDAQIDFYDSENTFIATGISYTF